MKNILQKIKSRIIDTKIYIARTMSWVSMANSLMLVFLVVERLKSLGVIKGDLGNSIILVVACWFCILVFLGWLEVKKIKAPHTESKKMLELNPPMKKAYTQIDSIERRIKKIEEKLFNAKIWNICDYACL